MPKEFNISAEFSGLDRKIVEEAVRKSNLPEGVNVIKGHEIAGAKIPFVVITWSPEWSEAREAFQAGAIRYVPADVNPGELAKKLSSQG